MTTFLVTREGAADGEKPRMVEARSKAQAIGFVARKSLTAEPVSMKAAISWTKEGVELETAGDE